MAKKSFEQELVALNDSLSKVTVFVHKNRLKLRATLPHKQKPGERKQYQIATGQPATLHGLKLARKKASDLQADIDYERFSWPDWDGRSRPKVGQAIGDLIEEAERQWLSARPRTDSQKANFKTDYLDPWQFLQSDRLLTEDYLTEVIKAESQPATRKRERFVRAYQKLAKLAEAEWSLKGLAVGYTPEERRIPQPDEIEASIDLIQSSKPKSYLFWRWVYGVLAAYGLRPHEPIVGLDLSDTQRPPHIIRVPSETKTGFRSMLPICARWVRLWRLWDAPPSPVSLYRRDGKRQKNKTLGGNVCKAFARYGIPFNPYDLRHAAIIQSTAYKNGTGLAAKNYGHSEATHDIQYRRWLNEQALIAGWVNDDSVANSPNSSDVILQLERLLASGRSDVAIQLQQLLELHDPHLPLSGEG